MKSSGFKISILVKGCDEKTAENYRNCYIAEKHIVSYQRYQSQNLILQIEDLNEDCVKISRIFSKFHASDRFIVLNDSTSPKMFIKIYFNFFRFFFKGLRAV